MLDIGRVIADHCGGRVNGITDGDVAKPYLSDIECTPTLHIEPDDRLPSTERNVWSNYHVEARADEGQETILDRAIRTLTELPCNLCLLYAQKIICRCSCY